MRTSSHGVGPVASVSLFQASAEVGRGLQEQLQYVQCSIRLIALKLVGLAKRLARSD